LAPYGKLKTKCVVAKKLRKAMDVSHCHVCGNGNVSLFQEEDANPHQVVLCGEDCQRSYHGLATIAANPIVNPKAHSMAFRSSAFYRDSAKLLRSLKRDDVFAFLSLSHYGQQSAVNPILFKVEGNWKRMGQFMKLVPNFSRMLDPKDPYDIWDKFFASMLQLAPGFGAPFTDRSGKHVIVSKADLLRYYPEMRPYLEMRDKVLFVRLYISAIQSAILSVPHSLDTSVAGWRGYSPIQVPNSLSQNLMVYKTGDRITNWGLGSVSLHHALSSGFADLDKTCCMMFIHFPAGFPIFMLTSDKDDKQFPSIPTPWRQMEILLPAGTIFQIGNPMGKLLYQPYNKGGKSFAIDTREVFIVGLDRNRGYIDKAKRLKIVGNTGAKPVVHKGKGRKARLFKYVQTLYHQTSPEAAKNIIATQTMLPGKAGYAGAGIYFADNPQSTYWKAAGGKGVILQATVLLGNSKTIFAADKDITWQTLQDDKSGPYDSVFLILGSGVEHVVYKSDQVRDIRLFQPKINEDLRLVEAVVQTHFYRQQPFYHASAEHILFLKKHDIFAYLCLALYGFSPGINKVMFALKGNWSTAALGGPSALAYDVYANQFKHIIEPQIAHPLTDKTGTQVINTREALVRYYPEIQPYLRITDSTLFSRLYMSAIRSAIMGTPRSRDPPLTYSWRGYKPVPIAGSLALNPSAYKEGEIMINWGVTSVSVQENVAANFGGFDQACCMMVVLIPSEFPIFLLTSDETDATYPTLPTPYREIELLLPAGTRFRIGRHLGQKPYTPRAAFGQQYMLDTIEVHVIGISKINSYIPSKKRAEWAAKQ
jgi:hypothetical protein